MKISPHYILLLFKIFAEEVKGREKKSLQLHSASKKVPSALRFKQRVSRKKDSKQATCDSSFFCFP